MVIAWLGRRIGVVAGGGRRRRRGVDSDEVCDGVGDKEGPFEGIGKGGCESDTIEGNPY